MNTTDDQLLNGDDMAALLYPVFSDSSVYQKPEEVESQLKSIHSKFEGQWDEEAEELLANTYDRYKKASNLSTGDDWISAFPPSRDWENKQIPPEERIAKIDEWANQAKDFYQKEDPTEWALNAVESKEKIQSVADELKRQVSGEDTGRVKDAASRVLEAGGTYFADLFGAEDTSRAIKEYFPENPKYDEATGSKELAVIGQAGGQLGVPLGLAAGVGGLAIGVAGAGKAAALSLAAGTFTLAQSLLGYIGGYREAHDEVYNATGSEYQADRAGIKSGLSTAGAEVVANALVAKSVLKPFVLGLNPTRQSRLVAAALSASRTGAISAASEGVTEGVQDLATQLIVGDVTGKNVDYSQVGESAYLGAVGGGAVTGVSAGVSGLTRFSSAKLAELSSRKEDPQLEEKKTVQQQRKEEAELEPLTQEEEISLARQLEEFADNPNTETIELDSSLAKVMPMGLLETLGLEATPTASGLTVKKSPFSSPESTIFSLVEDTETISPEVDLNNTEITPEVTFDEYLKQIPPDSLASIFGTLQKQGIKTPPLGAQGVKPSPETQAADTQVAESRRAFQFITPDFSPSKSERQLSESAPKVIKELEARLARVPTRNDLARIYQQEAKAYENLKKETNRQENATDLERNKQLLARQQEKVVAAKSALDIENQTAKNAYTREAIKDLIVAAKMQLNTIDETGQYHYSEDVPNYSPVRDNVKIAESRAKSSRTGAEYTGAFNPTLRGLVDSWLSGFGFSSEGKVPKVYVGSYFDLLNGALDGVTKNVNWKTPEVMESIKTTDGLTIESKGKYLVLLRNTQMTPENIQIASHEIGHVVAWHHWNNAGTEVQNKVFEDYQAAVTDALQHKTAQDIAKDLGVREGLHTNDIRTFDELTLSEQEYLIGKEQGFNEWFANQVSDFLVDPTIVPVTPSQRLYKTLAQAFKQIWGAVSSKFRGQSVPLRQWLNEQFSLEKARETFPTPVEFRKRIPKGEGQKNMSVSQRISRSDVSRRIKEGTRNQVYTPLSPKETLATVKQKIRPDNLGFNIAEALNEKNDITDDVRAPYMIAIKEELDTQLKTEKDPVKKLALEDMYIELINAGAEMSLRKGRFIQALTLLKNAPRNVLFRSTLRDVEKAFERAKRELPADYDKIIKDIADKYHPKLKGKEGHLLQEVNRQMYQELDAKLDIPTTGALKFFWYGNFLSGIDTQVVNVAASGLDVFMRTAASVVTNPKDIPAFIASVVPSFREAMTKAEANLRGRRTREAQANKFGVNNAAVAPIVKWENKVAAAAMNKMLGVLEKYPFRLLRTSDAFFATFAKEQQAFVLASKALRKIEKEGNFQLTKEEFAQRMHQELFKSDPQLKAFKEQATKEVDEVYAGRDISPGARENSINLRVFELVDAARDPELTKEAYRYGDLITYTQRPEGTFGVIADVFNALNRDLVLTRYTVLPFVDVIANVLSRSMDYSPVGMLRGWHGTHLSSIFGKDTVPFSEIERRQRAAIGAVSTAAWGGLMYVAASALSDSEESGEPPWFEWNGYGPPGKNERTTWLAAGNKPYTFRVGNRVISYHEAPGAPMMALGGALMDQMRYNPKWEEMELTSRALLVAQNIAGSITEMGFLNSISNIAEIASGKRNIVAPLGTAVAGVIPGQGFLRNLTNLMDPTKVDYRDVKATFMANLPYAKSLVRPQLNMFGEPLTRANRFLGKLNSDPTINWMTEKGLILGNFAGQEVGTSRSTSEKAFFSAIKANREKHLGRYASGMLTEEEVFAIHQMSGPRIKSRIQGLMGLGWSTEALQATITKIANQERNLAKSKLLMGQYRELNS